ncbi:MAG: T9SS type A sorting domain-containing protein [Bacteroidetes bacterium]|nr:T9SS type A sorting domain-containing protein [Bacteroidota bacterium]
MYHKYFYIFLFVACLPLTQAWSQARFEANAAAQSFTAPAGMYAGEIDQDGDQDILAASGDHGVFIVRNDGGNPIQWTPVAVDANLGASLTVWMDDIDSDGYQDILTGGWDTGQVVWYKNNGDSQSWTKMIIATGFQRPHEVMTSDIDLDGDPDVLVSGAGNNQITWWSNNNSLGTSWTKQIISDHFMGSRSVGANDLDNDGDIDVVGASLDGHEITIWRNDGGTPINWTEVTLTNTFNGSHRVELVDMNQDGLKDILGTAYMESTIAWWQNTGDISVGWEKHIVDNTLTGAVMGSAHDFDHDGDMDVVGTAQPSHTLAWYENTGDPELPWKKNILDDGFGGIWPLCVADFDNDMNTDFAVGGNTANKITWFRNVQEGRLSRVMDLDGGKERLGLFIPPDVQEPAKLFLALPYCGDPFGYSRLRDMLIALAEETGGIVMVPEAVNAGAPNYVLQQPSYIQQYIAYAIANLNIQPDSIYLIGMDCNGLPVLDYGQSGDLSVLGVIPFNPRISSIPSGGFEGYPDVPVCLCSGTLHSERQNHQTVVNSINSTYGKAWMNDLDGVGEEVLIGDMIAELLNCVNYIDTVKTNTSSRIGYGAENSIMIYPNPAHGYIQLLAKNGFGNDSRFSLLDASGREILTQSIENQVKNQRIQLNHLQLAKGLYYIKLQANQHVSVHKLMIQ